MDVNRYLEIRRQFNVARSQSPSGARIIFDELAIMCTMYGKKGLTASQIAEKQSISCPTMTHRGNHLDTLGYMVRASVREDRRRISCTLTRKGNQTLRKTVQFIAGGLADAGFEPVEEAVLISEIATMGTLPMTADSLVLLALAAKGVVSIPIMRIVDSTALLQPTVSMAVLRLEEDGYVEQPVLPTPDSRRPMRRASGCDLTDEGIARGKEIAELVRAL